MLRFFTYTLRAQEERGSIYMLRFFTYTLRFSHTSFLSLYLRYDYSFAYFDTLFISIHPHHYDIEEEC